MAIDGFVPQSVILFNDTIKENIILDNNKTNFNQKAFHEAIRNAQLIEFVNEKNQKFYSDEKVKIYQLVKLKNRNS